MGRLSSTDLKQVLLHYYYDHYSLNDDIDPRHPLHLVLFRESEKSLYWDIVKDRFRLYIDKKIYEYTGWTFDEFYSYPSVFVDQVIGIITKDLDDKEKQYNELQEKDKETLRKIKESMPPQ